ncbi:NapC/NirT family cytochrome c [Neobacillus sp.]|uniref:cytochrome c3 family protein n=1 Tax=Neobacillus sp. TaxID=2675273 RepID=UPI00289C19EC|nr:NapC/NirT family cytochrome c [Neobacillus sp.]
MAYWKKKQAVEPGQNPDVGDSDTTSREEKKAKNRIKRWRLLVLSLMTFIAVICFLYGAISFTSTTSFCSSCHEMAPEHVTFQESAHNQIQCIQCHNKPGTSNLVENKVEILKEVYNHIVGPPDPIVPKVAVSNENCEQCHSRNRLVTATGDLKVNHKGHIKKGIPCITCHSGIVHAKVVERGINDSTTYFAWTKKNSKKLMDEKYVKPNMGTCIDCHNQVNQGKKPWKDITYSLPKIDLGKEQKEKVEEVFKETPEMKAGVFEREIPENTQKVILEAIGKEQTDVKISMECFTCHQTIKKPKNHENHGWSQLHGETARNDLNRCLNCHQNSLWMKNLEKQDIKLLLTKNQKEVTYKKDLHTLIKESRSNHFCSTCHAYSPANHKDRYTWLTDTHRYNSGTSKEREKCFVCHDNKKPEVNGKNNNAPSDVYCEFCHKGKFTDEPF